MKHTLELIKNFFEKGKWKYSCKEYDETHVVFSSGVNMNNAIGNLRIFVVVRQDYYIVNVLLNSAVEKRYYNQVAEYLHRANYGMNNGNFEFDFEDGEIRYKTYVNFEGVQLSDNVVADSILVPIFMFDKYGKNLLRLMLGEANAKELVEEAEKQSLAPAETL